MGDHRPLRAGGLDPFGAGPSLPAVLLLVEHVERLVTELGELGAPPGATAHGAVREHRADDVDLLAVVDLVPERLQDLPNRLGFRVTAVHQPRYVLETDVAGQ